MLFAHNREDRMEAPDTTGFKIAGSVLEFPGATEDVAEASRLYLALIGAVAAAWSQFEATIDTHILGIGRIPVNAGRCLTAQLIGPASRMSTYIALARLHGADKFAAELEDFANETTRLAEQRNRIIHDPWSRKEKGTLHRLETTARRKLRHEHIPVSLTALNNLVRRIETNGASARLPRHTDSCRVHAGAALW